NEYRREREQQFHRDFSAWRRRRHGNPPPLQPGMTQSGLRQDTDGTLELTSESPTAGLNEPDPTDTATLGTTSGGRRRSSAEAALDDHLRADAGEPVELRRVLHRQVAAAVPPRGARRPAGHGRAALYG